jgi:two-component system cell cycle sensor histidine kinase/response regulator CckA
VHSIVEQSGGHIRVSSEPSQGSCFQVYFSLAEPAREAESSAPLRTGSGVRRAVKPPSSVTVLLVEDEPIVRAVARRLLESAGYRVLCAENGERALALSSGHGAPIELLVTDVVMSGLDGPSLATRLRAERPGLRTLFISGYSQDHAVPQESLEDGIGFLSKPFSYDSLTSKVAELLAAKVVDRQPASGRA